MCHKLKEGAILIADSHYPNHKKEEFLALLNAINSGKIKTPQLIFMGDNFDLLVGNSPYLGKLFKKEIELIKEIATKVEVIYLEGNHDFYLKPLFKTPPVIPAKAGVSKDNATLNRDTNFRGNDKYIDNNSVIPTNAEILKSNTISNRDTNFRGNDTNGGKNNSNNIVIPAKAGIITHLNIKIIPIQKQPLILKLNNQTLSLSHGDKYDTTLGYKLYTTLIRNPIILKLLPDLIAIKKLKLMANKNLCKKIQNFNIKAKSIAKNYKTDLIIEGHFHQGLVIDNYISLPSFACSGEVGVIRDGGVVFEKIVI